MAVAGKEPSVSQRPERLRHLVCLVQGVLSLHGDDRGIVRVDLWIVGHDFLGVSGWVRNGTPTSSWERL